MLPEQHLPASGSEAARGEKGRAAAGRRQQVMEEIGHDVSGMVDARDFIEVHRAGQRTKLFIVPGVDEQARPPP